MSLRYYVVRHKATRQLVRDGLGQVMYFSSKRRAKAVRNQVAHDTREPHEVALGPDHKRKSNDTQRQDMP